MDKHITIQDLIHRSIRIFSISTARYLILAGIAYLLFYVIWKEKWTHKKIQERFPDKTRIWFEFKYSMLNMLIFVITGLFVFYMSSLGYNKFYKHIADYGWGYFFISIIIMIFMHDTYFYWMHRFMHIKALYPYVHKVHHQSINPTPWAAFSFHPLEGFLEAAIVPIITLLIPVHPAALFIFILFSTMLNVLGHLGFEIYPKGFTKSKWMWWNNTSTHHNMHHHYFDYNYGLYFNIWDRLMGTNHPQYHETFEEMASRNKS